MGRRKKRSSRGQGRRGTAGSSVRSPPGGLIPKPPQFIASIMTPHTFRFTVTTAGGYTVTTDNLLNLWCVASAATTTSRLIQGLKLKRVRIWGQPPSLGAAAVTASIEWSGGGASAGFGPSWQVSDTSQGITPAYVDARPPKGSLASFWINDVQTGNIAFTLTLPLGAVVDLHTVLVMKDTEAVTAGQTTSGATTGRVYGCYLASANLPPVGLTTLP